MHCSYFNESSKIVYDSQTPPINFEFPLLIIVV